MYLNKHEVRQHERKGAGDPFKIFRSQATQAKAERWHFFWKHMYGPELVIAPSMLI